MRVVSISPAVQAIRYPQADNGGGGMPPTGDMMFSQLVELCIGVGLVRPDVQILRRLRMTGFS